MLGYSGIPPFNSVYSTCNAGSADTVTNDSFNDNVQFPAKLIEIQNMATRRENIGRRGVQNVKMGYGKMQKQKKPFLSKQLYLNFAKWSHGADHSSKLAMNILIRTSWEAPGFTVVAEKSCQNCYICTANNMGR